MVTGNFINPECIKEGGDTINTPQQLPNVQMQAVPMEHQMIPYYGNGVQPVINHITVNPVIECKIVEKTKNSPLSDLMGPFGLLSKFFN